MRKDLVDAFGPRHRLLTAVLASLAGAGTKTPIRDVARLVAEHGGHSGDWAKVTSATYKIVDGVTVEVHGYMNMATRAVVELKSKVGLWSP